MGYAGRKRKQYNRTFIGRFNRYAPRVIGGASGAALGFIHSDFPGAVTGAKFGWNAGKYYAKQHRLKKADYRKKLVSNQRWRFRSGGRVTGSNPGHVFGSNPGPGQYGSSESSYRKKMSGHKPKARSHYYRVY